MSFTDSLATSCYRYLLSPTLGLPSGNKAWLFWATKSQWYRCRVVLGKPIGVMLCCFLILKFGIAQMPRHVNWGQLFGVSLLCGIGFTMSLFIGSLAFGGMGNPLAGLDRLGILTGSILSAVVGFFVLKKALPERSFCVVGSKPLR